MFNDVKWILTSTRKSFAWFCSRIRSPFFFLVRIRFSCLSLFYLHFTFVLSLFWASVMLKQKCFHRTSKPKHLPLVQCFHTSPDHFAFTAGYPLPLPHFQDGNEKKVRYTQIWRAKVRCEIHNLNENFLLRKNKKKLRRDCLKFVVG